MKAHRFGITLVAVASVSAAIGAGDRGHRYYTVVARRAHRAERRAKP